MNSKYKNFICEPKFPPKTPHSRPTLPRMKDLREQEEPSDDEASENSVTDGELYDEPVSPPEISRNTQSTKSVLSQTNTSNEKTEKFIPTSNSKISKKLSASRIQQNERNIGKILIFIISGMVVILAVMVLYTMDLKNLSITNDVEKTVPEDNDIIENFGASVDHMSDTFKRQHSHIWNEIYAGVVDIIKHPKKRSIIFLFSNDDDPMFCLAKVVGNATQAVLRTDDSLWLNPTNLGDNYGSVIDRFEELIKERKIVIVENLLDVHPEAIRAFHNLCDSENPLVRQTIYIITMIAQGYRNDERPINFVEEQLSRKLKGKINPDKLQPLITRLTDAAIIHVQPEPDIESCPVRY